MAAVKYLLHLCVFFASLHVCASALLASHFPPTPLVLCLQGVFVWRRINELFNYLPLAASIEGKILCMHGGIGRSIHKVGAFFVPQNLEQRLVQYCCVLLCFRYVCKVFQSTVSLANSQHVMLLKADLRA